MELYPLLFKPAYKERVWGGRKLERYYNDGTFPEGEIGEAWIVADHPHGESLISNGKLQGKTINSLIKHLGCEWFGTKFNVEQNERFPLLIKLLDCNDDLSIQVHPNDEYEHLPKGERGKTEMWVVLEAKPNAKIVFGLKKGITREQLALAIEEKRIMDCLVEISVKAGDVFYIPSGTVHALGAGLLVAEVQQNSDTTYRVFDYDRPGLDGNVRELHLEDALNVIQYGESKAGAPNIQDVGPNQWIEICKSPFFVVERGICDGTWDTASIDESFSILLVSQGSGVIEWGANTMDVKVGQAILIPAKLGRYYVKGCTNLIRIYLP